MEPDVIRLYSSSPPPLDDGAEEDDDDFGDFGAFSGVPASVSFTEFDTQPVFAQSQTATAADTSPPNHFAGLGPGPLGRGPSDSDPQGADLSAGHEGRAPAKTVSAEERKKPLDQTQCGSAHLNSSEPEAGGDRTKVETHSCNGGFAVGEVLTNGFVAFDGEDGTPCPSLDHPINKGTTAPTLDYSPPDTQDEPHGFSAFGGAVAPRDDGSEWVTDTRADRERSDEGKRLADGVCDAQSDPGEAEASGEENGVRDSCSTRPDTSDLPAVAMETLSNGDRGSLMDEDSEQRDTDSCRAHPDPAAVDQGGGPVIQNGTEEEEEVGEEVEEEVGEEVDEEVEEKVDEEVDKEIEEEGKVDGEVVEEEVVEEQEVEESDECKGTTGCDDGGAGRGGKGVENEVDVSVSESFASFCQAVSPEGEEGFGDFSTPGVAPSACPDEETLTPADPSWPTEEEEDFGDFGDACSFSGPGFADFDRTESEPPAESAESAKDSGDDEGKFGDFSAPREGDEGKVSREGFADFPGSDSFADFSAAPAGAAGADSGSGWNAFEDQEAGGGDSWAAFGEEESTAPSESQKRVEDSIPVTAPPSGSPQTCRRDSLSMTLASRLERLFRASFSDAPPVESGEEVLSLRILLDPPKRPQEEGDEGDEEDTLAPHEDLGRVWRQLLEIHDALGLRYQWGGSHSNKALLCSLGIDTRNILFTGQKKQPVIVPMYAASLGMLEPTKEPVKPISAAEKIASIAQAPPVSPEMSTCSPDPSQEALPPVQFDWSSSGLTNPLDASGGSCLLNLDFFGPVDDSSSSSATSIPGVDPELYELTTAKMDTSNTSSRIADAFARLMSTVEKTSTSTRKPRKEENLSQEAAKVIAELPDLSFMQAKVLMFPTTLTPLGCSAPTPD